MEIKGCSPNDCRCFNECTSIHDGLYPPCARNAMESQTTAVQQLNAKIAAAISQYYNDMDAGTDATGLLLDKLRQLSALNG